MEQKEHFHIYLIMLLEEAEGIKNPEILESYCIFCDLKKIYRSMTLDGIFSQKALWIGFIQFTSWNEEILLGLGKRWQTEYNHTIFILPRRHTLMNRERIKQLETICLFSDTLLFQAVLLSQKSLMDFSKAIQLAV